jgi:hypothetical protein
LIYRINDNEDGNAEGPPDEVYIYRPDGTSTANGLISFAPFSDEFGREEFNDYTNPRDFLGSASTGHINISNIVVNGETVTFHYDSVPTAVNPVAAILSPAEGSILPYGNIDITASASQPAGSITRVDFYVDNALVGSDNSSPYAVSWECNNSAAGLHQIKIVAVSATQASTERLETIRVIDPQQATWFDHVTDNPLHTEFGRGAVPIQIAVDFDLGNAPYKVKQIAFAVTDDPYGNPANPGLVYVSVNRFASIPQDEMLLDAGAVQANFAGLTQVATDSTITITGKIAVVLNLYEYQNMVFDSYGLPCHTWVTEPDRPWIDAVGRGLLGAADIRIQLRSTITGNDEEIANSPVTGLSNYPNPFNPRTTIAYSLVKKGDVELSIYNIRGQKVKTINQGKQETGQHSIIWNGSNDQNEALASGVYFAVLQQDSHVLQTHKLVLLK